MPTTPGGRPYPAPSVVPDVPYWLQLLAEAGDTLETAVKATIPAQKMAAAGINHTTAAAGVTQAFAVIFPAGRFSATPRPSVIVNGTGTVSVIYVSAVTSAGMTINYISSTTGSKTFFWTAIQDA